MYFGAWGLYLSPASFAEFMFKIFLILFLVLLSARILRDAVYATTVIAQYWCHLVF